MKIHNTINYPASFKIYTVTTTWYQSRTPTTLANNESSSSTSNFSQTLNQLNTNLPRLVKILNIQQVKLDRTNDLIW